MNWEGYEVEGQMDITEFLDDKGENMNESAEKLFTNYSTMLSELEQYRAIGTVEEWKEYKLKEFQCHLAQQEGITIGYNKAIDEFAEELLKVSEGNIDMYVWCSDIKRIAEQMKAGGNNESN